MLFKESMSVRKSSRSNKGRNKYRESLIKEETPIVSINHKIEQNSQKDSTQNDEIVSCRVCGTYDFNYNAETDTGGDMIQCDKCDTWQHINCMTKGEKSLESYMTHDDLYYCERCDPKRYPHLANNTDIQSSNSDNDEPYKDEGNMNNSDDEYIIEPTKQEKRPKLEKNNGREKKKRKSSLKDDIEANEPKESHNGDDRLRQNASKMFKDLFLKYIIPHTLEDGTYKLPSDQEADALSSIMSLKLEKALYEACLDADTHRLSKYYPERVRSLFSNLKDKKNSTLKAHVINKEIPYEKLVRMTVSELANPDLQQFKEKIDTQSLNQVTIEREEGPLYVKTHKGDELILSRDDFEEREESIFATDNITRRENDEGTNKSKNMKEAERRKNTSHINKNYMTNVKLIYSDVDLVLTGKFEYLGASLENKKTPFKEALGDGNLLVEGKLSVEKGLSYINEIRNLRNILIYKFEATNSKSSEETAIGLAKFMLSSNRILGIRVKHPYEKNIYIFASGIDNPPVLISSLLGEKRFSVCENNSKNKLYALVIIKPELVV